MNRPGPLRDHVGRCAATLLALLIIGILAASDAEATQQIEEVFVIEGRAHRMLSTPLESWLDRWPERPKLSQGRESSCWRGYVGTWVVHAGHLELLGLREPRFGGSQPGSADDTIPLSRVFGKRKAPIRATWFSGVLRIAMGRRLRSVRMGFGTRYERTLFLRVKQGRLVGRWEVDNLREAFSRSTKDLQWVALAFQPPSDDGLWRDARSLAPGVLRKRVPLDRKVRTRGVLCEKAGEAHKTLWIPDTPASEGVRIKVLGAAAVERPLPHVELTGTWGREGPKQDRELILKCQTLRVLDPGETIHHPSYRAPDLEKRLREAAEHQSRRAPTAVLDKADLEWLWGETVELMAPIGFGKVATILGVEVRAGAALDGKDATASGRLEKWIITKRLLLANKHAAAHFGKRGPGTYYRLVDPANGALVCASAQ